MADNTHIEWTDATWNPITGCTVVSEGCRNCYAMELAGTRLKSHPSRAGLTRQNADGHHVWTGEVRFNEQWLTQPLAWKRPRMVFVCAHGDLFHKDLPDEWLDRVFAVMALCPHHVFQVLTKRPERMREYLNGLLALTGRGIQDRFSGAARRAGLHLVDLPNLNRVITALPLPNVWLGTSVENQKTADERIPYLLDTLAAVRWISAEPLLGPVDLTLDSLSYFDCPPDCEHGYTEWDIGCFVCGKCDGTRKTNVFGLDWVVVGGESGPHARPMHPDWARSLRDQAAAANVPFFFKQWGAWMPCPGASDWPYDKDYDRTTWFGEPECVRPVDAGWSDKYHTGHCRAEDPTLLKPYGGSLFKTPEFLGQVARCPQGSCREAGKCQGNSARQPSRYVGKAAAGRLLDGVEHNAMPEGR